MATAQVVLESRAGDADRDPHHSHRVEPVREAVFERAGHPIHVFESAPGSSKEGVFVCATIAASDPSLEVRSTATRRAIRAGTELYLCLTVRPAIHFCVAHRPGDIPAR
jgi:hypothetical protein